MDGESIRELIDGATYLFTNEYEAALTEQKRPVGAGDEIASVSRHGSFTKGKNGRSITTRGERPILVTIATKCQGRSDRRGRRFFVPGSFRSGMGFGSRTLRHNGLDAGTYVVETVGTQEYQLGRQRFLERFTLAYGAASLHRDRTHLVCLRPDWLT